MSDKSEKAKELLNAIRKSNSEYCMQADSLYKTLSK